MEIVVYVYISRKSLAAEPNRGGVLTLVHNDFHNLIHVSESAIDE